MEPFSRNYDLKKKSSKNFNLKYLQFMDQSFCPKNLTESLGKCGYNGGFVAGVNFNPQY